MLADHRLGAPEVDALEDLLGERPEHDRDPLELGHRALRGDRVIEQWAAVELGQQLRLLSESGSGAGGEDQAADQAGHLVDPALALREPAAVAPVAGGDDLGQDRQRGLLPADRAEVEADRRGDPLELVFGEPQLEQPLAPLGLGATRPHRADEPRRRAERE